MTTTTEIPPGTPWWTDETVLAIHEVPKLLPKRRNGKSVCIQTVYRWRRVGVHGIKLRCFLTCGQGMATTREELARWQQAISSMADQP